jgi:oleate hydratase
LIGFFHYGEWWGLFHYGELAVSKYYFVGSGIASLAGAAFLIRDGKVSGKDIVILEESHDFGGAFDAHGDAKMGYYMSGSRMFEAHYVCTFALLDTIPSVSNPNISIKKETELADKDAHWFNRTRLVDRDGRIPDFHTMGFDERDRLDLIKIMGTPEDRLDGKRISDCFTNHFFQTNFWYEWCTLFAFERWHSAIEFKRYLLRFVHHFSTIDTQEGIYRTKYNQYDAIAVPLVRWLRSHDVEFRFHTRVTDLDFAPGQSITVTGLHYRPKNGDRTERIEIGESDRVFVTNGSMTADKHFGSTDKPAVLERDKKAGAWQLWEKLAQGRPEFGNPSVFSDNIGESSWISCSVTCQNPLFLQLIERFSGRKPGTGGLITFKDSNWLLTASIFYQPFFVNQPDDVAVWWFYGLFHDRPGDYVKKTMAECTGREMLEELLGHLHFSEADKKTILDTSIAIPCMMPYITSQFMVRSGKDRPKIIPKGSTNLAFIGQFAEQPDDVVFTVEYSIRGAQTAVYKLLNLDLKVPPVYKGIHDPTVIVDAIRTLHR